MNLDDLNHFKQTDSQNMLSYIDALPQQLEDAWNHGQSLDLPPVDSLRQIVICGMGGSAISGDLLASLGMDTAAVPINVVRGYHLPAYATGPDTLVIALSHSGNTEETLSMAADAIEQGATIVAITTGGKLAGVVDDNGGTVWTYQYDAQPRASMGWLYGLLLAAVSRLGVIEIVDDVKETLDVLRKYQQQWGAESSVARNAAKRYAGQMVDCIPVIWGSGILAPVARRWKTQINENAKSNAMWDELPELNHNTVVGIVAPDELMRRHKFQVVQLTSTYDHPRVALRHELTHEMLLGEAIITDPLRARGKSRLAQQLSMVLFGDYVSYYLAMAYQIDPTPIDPIMMLKHMMAQTDAN